MYGECAYASVEWSIEVSVCSWDCDLLVVFIHFWQVIAIFVEFLAHLVPPHREVLSYRFPQIRTMRSWLADSLMERSAGTLPVSCVYTQEWSNCDYQGESKHPHVCAWSEYRSHKWEWQHIPSHQVSYCLSRQLLQLLEIQFFHFEYLPLSQVVIINECQPVPVLIGCDGTIVVSLFQASPKGWGVQLTLESHNNLRHVVRRRLHFLRVEHF